MAPICGVCHVEDSKYKCPICELKYCSIACYKTHRQVHDNKNGLNETEEPQLHPKHDRPGTTQRLPKLDFTGFEENKDFRRLTGRYPLLKVQLQTIYGLTLEPGPDDARTWNRQSLPGCRGPGGPLRGPGRGCSRYGRGSRGSRGGRVSRSGTDSVSDERQHGPWTPEKGDKEALVVIKKIREGGDVKVDAAEGMREFVELCQLIYGRGR